MGQCPRRHGTAPVFRSLGGGDRPGAAGKYLESRAKRQTASAIRALEALRPERAVRVLDGREEDVAISQLRLDDVVLVKPGERFPVDGQVLEGSSHADEALISGESLPVPKQPATR